MVSHSYNYPMQLIIVVHNRNVSDLPDKYGRSLGTAVCPKQAQRLKEYIRSGKQ